ncbi:MAG: hypothetical protein J5923_04935 [Acidaminococcaceae bacterium]|nr:hypothetical protein [Acidaminococcaceae bacterium]MBO5636649.1 hypothetical protein [Acidaminococcaceae bacterium]
MDGKGQYGYLDEALDLIAIKRNQLREAPVPTDVNKMSLRICDVTEKIIVFAKEEFLNGIKPAVQTKNTVLQSEAEEELPCLSALMLLTMELIYDMEAGSGCADGNVDRILLPEIDLSVIPEYPDVLKAEDALGKLKRLEWLFVHFHKEDSARLFLKEIFEKTLVEVKEPLIK